MGVIICKGKSDHNLNTVHIYRHTALDTDDSPTVARLNRQRFQNGDSLFAIIQQSLVWLPMRFAESDEFYRTIFLQLFECTQHIYRNNMIGNKLELRTPDEAEIIYYEAFMRCDRQLMAALWADGEVVCIHPGAGAIVGHEKVVRSWSNIFRGAQRPDIRYQVVKTALSDDLAVHLVTEEISTGDQAYALILATNVYQKFEGGWLMVQHHASMVQAGRSQHTLQ